MELAEKCKKVLKMQNEYDEKYLPSVSSETPEHLTCNDRHHVPKSIDNSEVNFHNKDTSNYISNIPTSERVSKSKDAWNQAIWNEHEIQSKEINGVFFAKPINVTADEDQKEDITKYFADKKMNEEIQARY